MPNCEKISTPLMPDRITNDRPLTSVIIPTYNRARDLKEAVNSVLRQTYQNMEIIVVDDGSTDETHELMNSFTDQRIKYIKKKNERHPGKTRNVGLQAARGEYIAFLDDDDLWLPEKLEIQMAEMRKQPQYAWSYTHYKIFGTGESREYHIPPRQRNISGHILESLARFGSSLPHRLYASKGRCLIKRADLPKSRNSAPDRISISGSASPVNSRFSAFPNNWFLSGSRASPHRKHSFPAVRLLCMRGTSRTPRFRRV